MNKLRPDAHVELPNPFDRGDIVALLDQQGRIERYGIVWSSKATWEWAHEMGGYQHDGDEVLLVEVIDEATGEFVCRHVDSLHLERQRPLLVDETTRGYLVSAKLLMLGQGWLDDFFRARRAYCKAHIENQGEDV